MDNLEEVYIQDPNAVLVGETLKSYNAFKTLNTFIPVSNLRQFYIPLGM